MKMLLFIEREREREREKERGLIEFHKFCGGSPEDGARIIYISLQARS